MNHKSSWQINGRFQSGFGLNDLHQSALGRFFAKSVRMVAVCTLAFACPRSLGVDAPNVAKPANTSGHTSRPNIIWIMADDLGYGDLGCYGQQKIKTPHIDRMAAEGIRFTQAYCGTSVCAPSRCSLMTGQHMGHAQIRANRGGEEAEGEMPLAAGTWTVARVLQQAGYRTACIGKWGLGGPKKSTGQPNRQGFDYFFGYTGHGQAHEYYPDHLWRNLERVKLGGKSYSHDLFVEEALKWVSDHRDRPFFLYLPFSIPHSKLQVPDLGPYADLKWKEYHRLIAAMITRMDSGVGQLLARLKELNIDENTVVFFTSDNGPDRGDAREFFNASGPFRGKKRGMYEGGLRVPMIARWPGHAPAGKVSDEPWAFWDFLPTCADLARVKVPSEANIDGISIVPALKGGPMPEREYFYWEIHEPWSSRAVRFGDIKAVRPSWDAPIESYDLKNDVEESHNLADSRPDLVGRAAEMMKAAHADDPAWKVIAPPEDARTPPPSTRPK